jgi:hypothetical protein
MMYIHLLFQGNKRTLPKSPTFVLNEQELRNARFKGDFLKRVERFGEHPFWGNIRAVFSR